MKKLLLTFTLMLLASCEPPTQATIKASSSAASSAMAPSKWPASAFPLKVKVSTDFSDDEKFAIQDMGDAWNDSVNYQETFIDDDGDTAPKSNNLNSYVDSLIGVYKLSSWPSELPQTALAVTQIYGTRKNIGRSSEYIRIDHADILINYDNFDFTTDYSWGYDLQTIVLHEMGHLLGLYHDKSSVNESVMFPTITRSVNNRYPHTRDINNLKSKYGLSGSATSNAFRMPASTKALDTESDNEEEVIIQFEIMADGTEVKKIIKR
tara:strand:+ start:8835 stop:9629 length:795 start_codon:yes stop_codon:yes gene_type:complete